MRKLRLYIETSVWSHWFADDAPERRDETRAFLRGCQECASEVDLYVSAFVLEELGEAPGDLSRRLVDLVEELDPDILRAGPEVYRLADAYVKHGVLSEGRRADRLHAAIASVAQMDMLVSWNYRHLVNVSRREKINSANRLEGYTRRLEITTPPEVFEDEIQQEAD